MFVTTMLLSIIKKCKVSEVICVLYKEVDEYIYFVVDTYQKLVHLVCQEY